jgi:predicted CxxxxCH...CXXCH cytochrome family protein
MATLDTRSIVIHSSAIIAIIRFLAAGGLLFTLLACSSPNSLAPTAGKAHPARYLLDHAEAANADLTGCQSCHQADLTGGENVTSCFTCHEEDNGFAVHSLPYADPDQHGAVARNDQAGCLACHGTAPNRFDGGILADETLYASGTANCSSVACHPAAGAHPTNWQGSNDTDTDGYAASHRVVTQAAIDTGCALCHQVTVDGPAPLADAPSCFNATFTNSDGSTTGCHPNGPGEGAHDIPYAAADLHGADAKADLATCQACHGTPGSTDFDGGTSSVSCATADCHPAAGAHPTNWQGQNDTTTDYVSTHRNAGRQSITCSICHDYTQGRTAPHSSAPSCYSADYTNSDGSTTGCHSDGPGTTHELPFTDPADHGPEAKADLGACVSCHATPSDAGPGDNPRFNLAVGDLPQGCETSGCHDPFTAHPVPLWAGAEATSHVSAGNQAEACALCHGVSLNGGSGAVGPACTSCHELGSPLVLGDCASCHAAPPDDAASSVVARPNRDGAHSTHQGYAELADNCTVCHTNAGANSDSHFDTSAPATVQMVSTYNAMGSTAGFNSGSSTCSNVRCHGGRTTPNWYGGSIDVATDCESCHTFGSSEYNGYRSGEHGEHREEGVTCTRCHDAAVLANSNGAHLANMATTGFELDPWDTIKPLSQSCQQSGCHGAGVDFGDWD